jgi:hypothetical protein
MTHLCYTLEEAAEKLNLSETVLVRLSQYFKVPRSAYEEVGYVSFKDDLSFSDPDITFFRQVKERLLTGESLDEVKARIREEAPLPSPARLTYEPTPEPAISYHYEEIAQTQPTALPPLTESLPPVAPEPSPPLPPLQEVMDRAPYEKAAQKSFERYKHVHRTGLGKVFENMLKEVGGSGKAKSAKTPSFRPLRNKVEPAQPDRANRQDSVLPFKPRLARTEQAPASTSPPPAPPRTGGNLWNRTTGQDAAWEEIIQQASRQPRALNTHLKTAAALLRERVLQQPPASNHRDRR